MRPFLQLPLVLLCGAAVHGQQPASFDKDYAVVQDLLKRGLWSKAKPALEELLVRHQGSLEAIAEREALVEDMRRCAFGLAVVPPKAETLISGKVLAWNPGSGRIKLQYTPERMADFEGDPKDRESLLLHPATFRGDYTVTWRGEQFIDQHLLVVCELGSTNEFVIDFGGEASGGYYPVRLEMHRDGVARAGDEELKQERGSGPFTATVRVSKRSVELAITEAKRVLGKVARPEQPFGRFGFLPMPVREIVIEGDIEPSWMQGLVDQHMGKKLEEFAAKWKAQDALPKWLFETPSGKRTAPKCDDTLPGSAECQDRKLLQTVMTAWNEGKWLVALQHLDKMPAGALESVTADYLRAIACLNLGRDEAALAACDRVLAAKPDYTPFRLVRARVLEDQRRSAEAFAELERALAADPGEPHVYGSYVVAQLQRRAVREAELVVRRAKIDHGLWHEMKEIDQLLTMHRRGPAWQRRFVHLSTNYEIASDIDLRTCQSAAQVLETALVNLKAQLAWTDEAKKGERYRVFLFSGEAGYLDYCSKILGSAPSHTAGLYSPVLKQLLIWNVPKREDMERTVRHEGFHQFLDRVVDNAPSWWNEGMAEFWETAQREQGQLRGGQLRPDHHAALLRARGSLPKFEQFVHGTYNDFYANAQLRYPQAWAFVHFLRKGPRDYQQRFAKLWQELRGAGTAQKAIDTAFAGVDWAQLERDFWTHLGTLR